jgi:hypothetical protein
MTSIGIPLFLFGVVVGYWIFRKKEMPARVIAGLVCGCCAVGLFLLATILGGDHSGSAPQSLHPLTPKDEAEAPFVFSAGLKIENLTLQDYTTLNRDMGELLKRVGFVGCKGYLIPRPGIHGETNPEVYIEGKSKSNEVVKQMIEKEGIQSVADKLTLEFEKSRNAQNKTADSSR